MRYAVVALFVLAGCGPAPERPAAPPALPPPAAGPWFICDGIDAPALLVFERDGDAIRVAEYDKPNGALVARHEFTAGPEEGAAGSAYTTLLRDGAAAGAVRALNPEMLETPGAAYTTPVSSVRLGQREISCRWLPRTRLMGFTQARSFVVAEDDDGDLIYTSFDFADAAQQTRIDLSNAGRSTTFSAEARDGQEQMRLEGVEFRFAATRAFTYVVTRARDGAASLVVLRDGAEIQREIVIAAQQGSANP